MKILFLVYHGFSDASGITKKIHYQVKGLRENGHEVHLCYYDIAKEALRLAAQKLPISTKFVVKRDYIEE